MTTILLRLIVGLIVFLAWTPVASAWSWPVQGSVLQAFSYDATHPYASGQHRGVDIGAYATGETVVAPAAGTVSFAGTVPTSGKSVTIDTADGYAITLTHLGSILVANGAAIGEQDTIGTIGPSGTAEVEGPYVHLGIRLAADPNGYIDPLGLLPPASAESETDSGSDTSQPSGGSSAASASAPSSGAGSTSTPASEPAPGVSTSPPATQTQGSTVASKQSRVSPPAHNPRADVPAQPSSQRPALQERIREPRQAGMQQHQLGAAESSRRPVVETAAPAEPTGLAAGHEIHSSVPVARPSPSRRPTPTVLLPLLLNGAAAVVAVAAALAAARSRRRRRPGASAATAAQVFHLPPRAVERGPMSRAA